jgi:hypothetical protein
MHFAFLFGLIFVVIPFWQILSKAGYNGAWSLLAFIPVVNLVMLYVFAFSRWPSERPRQ